MVCLQCQGEDGEITWICPACKQPDDGSAMIGCDFCDDWYHWSVVADHLIFCYRIIYWQIRNWSHIAARLVLVVLLLVVVGVTSSKKAEDSCHFKLYLDEIWLDFSYSEYPSIDKFVFLIWHA